MTAPTLVPPPVGQTGTRTPHVSPSLPAVRALAAAGGGNCVPVYRELVGDLETPVTAYLKLASGGGGGYGFLLESVEGGERVGRYSFLGTRPRIVLRLHENTLTATHADGAVTTEHFDDPLTALGRYLAAYRPVALPGVELPKFLGGAVGYLGYESVRYFEPKVPRAARDPPRPAGRRVYAHGHGPDL